MDQITPVQPSIYGSYSGNQGNGNVFGSNNLTATMNIYMTPNVAGVGIGNQSNVFGAGDGGSRPYHLIPYGRNRTFTGRQNLLESIWTFCKEKGHNRVALYGLGGSGKTQIALEYVYRCISERDCDVFWVRGSGLLEFSEGFRAIAQRVRIPLAEAETDEEGLLLGIRRWFEGPNSGDWVLVVDNADNEVDFAANNSPIAKFIPQGTKGTLILTTRSRQVASRQGCRMMEVGKMDEEEAHELFSKRFGSWDSLDDEEKSVVSMILGLVHHLPLAVIGSAAFMIETATPPSVYCTIFQENEERMKKLLSQQFTDIQRETDVTESILGTYFVTFDRITQQMPSAAYLLQLMAFFDRQNIPEELLSQCGLEGMDDPVEFRRAIGKLLGFSLVTIVKREGKIFYELHRLVQLSLQVHLPMAEMNQWRGVALRVVSRIFPRDPDEWRYIGPTYISHGLAVTKYSTDPIAEELGFRMGEYFLDMGSYNNAEIQFRRCIALREDSKAYDWGDDGHSRFMRLGVVSTYQGKYDESEAIHRRVLELGPDHPDTLTSLSNLAVVLMNQGKYEESEATNRRALEGQEKTLGSNHPNTLASVRNLAAVLQGQGKYSESETANRRALEGYEKALGPNHPGTLRSVSSLAGVLQEQGKYDESEAINRRAVEAHEKVLGPDHPDTLASVSNLAAVLLEQGKYDESEAINRRALEGQEKVLGPNHPTTLVSVNNLAVVLQEQGRYDESETMNRRALEGREKALGPDHPDTLASVSNLATVLQEQGKYDESEVVNRRALEGREKTLGLDHPDTLASVNNLAAVLLEQGRYDESEAMSRRALEAHERVLGPDHPDTLAGINNLAVVLQEQGKYDESETMIQRSLDGHEKTLGPDHPDTLTSVSNLAVMLGAQGKYDESEAMNRRALEGRGKIFGLDHPDTLASIKNLAVVLQEQGKYDESEVMNRRALEGHEKVLGPDHPDTLACVNNLAAVLEEQGKYDESEAANRRALEGNEKTLGLDHPDTLTSVSNLAMVLRAQGKYDESEAMDLRALEGREKALGLDHPDTLASVSNLAIVLHAQGKEGESEEMNRRALEGREKVLGLDHPDTIASVHNLATVLR